jgi:hypothetical protein
MNIDVEFKLENVAMNQEIKEKMQQLLDTHLHLLTQYDIRQANERIKAFDNQLIESRNEKQKKNKFSFSSRKSVQKKKENLESPPAVVVTASNPKASDIPAPAKAKTYDSIQGELKVYQVDESESINEQFQVEVDDDIVVSNCGNANISFCCVIGAAYLKNLKNCKVFLGPVKSSIFIQNCIDCVFALASKQIRLHMSENCDFFVYAKSNPIIEHCKNVRFGPYNLQYPNIEKHFALANFDLSQNLMWKEVKDFNWLGASQSPNWSPIEQYEKILIV